MLKTAFNFMKYDLSKLFGILLGIVISIFLIGQQLGIFNSILGSMKGLTKYNPKYIWVVHQETQSAMSYQQLDMRINRELYSIPGVGNVYPIVITSGSAEMKGGTKATVQIVGLKSPDYIGGPSKYADGTNLTNLMNEGAVILDKSDQSMMENFKVGDYFTINNIRVYVAGMSDGMAGFGSSSVITTLERARMLGNIDNNTASAFLVSYDSTVISDQQLINSITKYIPNVKALKGDEFGDITVSYMMRTSNIAASFGMMVIFSVVAGFAIVGLTLFSSVNDRIRDYGTIKAIGAGNGYITKLILGQAALYAFFGFIISITLLLLYKYLTSGGKLQLEYPLWLIIFLIVVTFFISMIGSLFALRKIIKLEPVQIFRM